MKPDFRIEANGIDVTSRLRDRLVEIKVDDEAGLTSDRLEVSLDDRDHSLPVPPQNAEIKVWLGYSDVPGWGPAYQGRYTVDEITFSSGPKSLVIRAKAAELSGGFRRPKTRSWDKQTIGSIVTAIAKENGLKPKISEELANTPVDHLDQTEESDAALLSRLAEMNDATTKPADGALLFVKRGEGKTASGKPVPVVDLTPKDVTTWSVTIAERGAYGTVEAYYQNHGSGQRTTVRVGKGEPVYQIRMPYQSEGEARRAAEAKLAGFKRGKATLSLTLPGRPDVFAEGRVRLSGFRDLVNGLWSVKTVSHSYRGGGYSLTVSGETV